MPKSYSTTSCTKKYFFGEFAAPLDLYNEVKQNIDPCGGTLSVDDSVLDKPYAHHISYVGHFYSGKHHAVVKGINLITLYYTDSHGRSFPVNYRIYDKAEGKTKNDYFLEMLSEVLSWGLLLLGLLAIAGVVALRI